MNEIVCQVSNRENQVEFIWSAGGGYFRPYTVAGAQLGELREATRTVRKALGEMVSALNFAGDGAAAWEPAYGLAEAGFRLYNYLLPSEDETAKKIRRWLDELRKQSQLDALEIVVEEQAADPRAFLSVPWNLVYDERPAKHKPAFQSGKSVERWRPFWSIRYNLTSGRRVEPLKRMPNWSEPRVVVVVDPEVYDHLEDDQKAALDAFLAETGLTMATSMEELEVALEEGYPRLLYWMGHANPEYLQLGADRIAPSDLRNLLRSFDDRERPEGMLAFLNACQTAEAGQGGSFLDVLHSFGFTGAIATEQQTIDTFANKLGLAFLKGFLQEGRPLGELMHDLRLKMAPLGLLYGAHCPPEIRVKRASDAAGAAQPAIEEIGPISGVALQAPKRRTVARVEARAAGAARATLSVAGPLRTRRPRPVHRSRRRYRPVCRPSRPVRYADPDPARRERAGQVLVPAGRGDPLPGRELRRLSVPPQGGRWHRDYPGHQGPDRPDRPCPPRSVGAAAELPVAGRRGRSASTSGRRSTAPSGARPISRRCAAALAKDAGLFAALLAKMAGQLPHALVLVIDQAEELFTLARSPAEIEVRDHALVMIQRVIDLRADVKLIVSLRTEYIGRMLDHLRAGRQDLNGVRDDLLRDFSLAALVEAIERPTSATPIAQGLPSPREKYGFRFSDGVAARIAKGGLDLRTEHQDSVLPLIQVICTQLYEAEAVPSGLGRADHPRGSGRDSRCRRGPEGVRRGGDGADAPARPLGSGSVQVPVHPAVQPAGRRDPDDLAGLAGCPGEFLERLGAVRSGRGGGRLGATAARGRAARRGDRASPVHPTGPRCPGQGRRGLAGGTGRAGTSSARARPGGAGTQETQEQVRKLVAGVCVAAGVAVLFGITGVWALHQKRVADDNAYLAKTNSILATSNANAARKSEKAARQNARISYKDSR